ncbi:MAG: GNAT family N-acetyltransferase [candidate division WOR-3 bacterium]|nr:GNAT family N-acetyltransferase [candidate division WOR-3 bacterium]
MAAPQLKLALKPEVRPLRRDDARAVALLVAGVYAELGSRPAMSIEQTEQLFTTPWLQNGVGLVLECGSEVAGYGFARPTRWKGTDSIQLGLTLKHGRRDRETYHFLTDPLLEAAAELAAKYEISNITIHYRSTDTVHPPVIREIGFEEHPVSMLGFRHDLCVIPQRPLPPGFVMRPARLPEENATVLNLSGRAFDYPDRQGEPVSDGYLDFVSGNPGFDPQQVLLVENAGDPVAYTIVDATAYEGGGSFHITEIGVLPGSRNLGIGSALLSHVLGWMKTKGTRPALTGMFSSNHAATLFWRIGFRPNPLRTFRFFIRNVIPSPRVPTPEP